MAKSFRGVPSLCADLTLSSPSRRSVRLGLQLLQILVFILSTPTASAKSALALYFCACVRLNGAHFLGSLAMRVLASASNSPFAQSPLDI